jgi:subtilisin family serine protease
MNRKLILATLLLSPFAAVAALAQTPRAQEPSPELRALALQRIAERAGQHSDPEIVAASRAQLPLTGFSPCVFKVLDRATGRIHGIALDDSGAEVDMQAFQQAESAAQRARYGRLDPALHDKLASASPGERLPVLVWARELQPSRIVRVLPEEAEVLFPDEKARTAYLQEIDRQRDAEVQTALAPLIARCQAAGLQATPVGSAPALSLDLTVAEVQALAGFEEADRLYLDSQHEPEMDTARGTVHADFVENVMGISGAGVLVAQVEVGGRVQSANPFLAGVIQDGTFVCTSPNSHATAVAGCMRSRHTTVRGTAPNITLLATGTCAGSGSQAQNRAGFAADFGARVLNLSFGEQIPLLYPYGDSRFYDDLVLNRFRTVVASAGNDGDTINARVGQPASGYNLIAVGAFDDMDDTYWGNDSMAGFSSWDDPLSWHGDREKPDVSAPGVNLFSTTNSFPFTGLIGSGTSFAAPIVSGIVALMIQRNGTLGFWPEAVRAILMASADHNIEGSPRMSERDGAGGVNAQRADDITRFAFGGWGGISYGCGSPSPLVPTSMFLLAGKRTRIVIAWDTETAWYNSNYSYGPSADLDLSLVGPGGVFVASSASYDNTFEVIDVTPSMTGTYQLRIDRFACGQDPRYLGWAWTRDP